MELCELKDKSILILGFGKEGIDTFKILRKLFPEKVLGVGDRNENVKFQAPSAKKIKWHLGKNYLKALKNYALIIKSPGISIHLPEIEKAFKEGKITSQTEIFFDNWPPKHSKGWKMKANFGGGKLHRPGKIIGITGTKGKGTTSSLIYGILKEGGFKVHLVGNIEKPVLSALLKAKVNDIFVYELSSHQLYNLKKSPQIAVFLNLFAAHLDYYKNFNEYIRAKANITKHQRRKDILIYNYEDKLIREIAKESKAQKIPFSSKIPFEFLSSWRKSRMKGNFNLLNVMAAVTVGKILGISKKDIARAIEKFKPLSHRLEFVGKCKGIEFYNDSLATVPQAVEAALEALENNKVRTLILGGYGQGSIDFTSLAKKILESRIRTLIFLSPGTAEIIWQKILSLKTKKRSLPEAFFVSSMKKAVKIAYQKTKRGEICLLSPASPSFNLFRDYKERGNLFKKNVKKYAR